MRPAWRTSISCSSAIQECGIESSTWNTFSLLGERCSVKMERWGIHTPTVGSSTKKCKNKIPTTQTADLAGTIGTWIPTHSCPQMDSMSFATASVLTGKLPLAVRTGRLPRLRIATSSNPPALRPFALPFFKILTTTSAFIKGFRPSGPAGPHGAGLSSAALRPAFQ